MITLTMLVLNERNRQNWSIGCNLLSHTGLLVALFLKKPAAMIWWLYYP